MQNTNETFHIPEERIAGYIMLRSPTDKFKYNVLAVDANEELLFAAATDLSFEQASAMVDAINQEYYPVVPTPTEIVELELVGQNRIFKVAKE